MTSISVKIVGSSSSGNCGLLINSGHYYLIDAGFSGKKIKEKLSPLGITPNDLSGIFITHEHQDHILGLKALSKIKDLKFYANYKTAQAIENQYKLNAAWCIFDTQDPFVVNDLEVKAFSIPHDASDPVGFLFKSENECCAWATDLGHITKEITPLLSSADILILESNYDTQLLWNHPTRPQYLKERIASQRGHLSNQEAFNFIKNTPNHWQSIHLVHVSKDCNSVQLLKQLFQPLALSQHFDLEIVDPVLEHV